MWKNLLVLIAYCQAMTIQAQVQVQVRYEPRHHNVFENEFVRILDVHLAPGDTTQYHLHNTPSVFTFFTTTKTGSQLQGESSASNTSSANKAQYDSLVSPRIHRVWNEDNHWFHVMDIELTGGKPRSNVTVLKSPALKLLFNRALVNGYQVQLKSNAELQLPVSASGYLLVSYGNAKVNYKTNKVLQYRIMKSGHYIWVDAGNATTIRVSNDITTDFLLLQLK